MNKDLDLIPFLKEGIKVGAKCFRDKFGFYPLKLLHMLRDTEIVVKGKRDRLVTWELIRGSLPEVSKEEVDALINTSKEIEKTILKEDNIQTPVLKSEDIKIAEADEYVTPDVVETVILEKPVIPSVVSIDPIIQKALEESTPEKMFPEAFKDKEPLVTSIAPEVLQLAAEMNKEVRSQDEGRLTKLTEELKAISAVPSIPVSDEIHFVDMSYGVKVKKVNGKVTEIIPISVDDYEKLPSGLFNNQRKEYDKYIEGLKKEYNL